MLLVLHYPLSRDHYLVRGGFFMTRCLRCGRPLRSRSSVLRGAGPRCAKLLLRQAGIDGRMPRGWSAASDTRLQELLSETIPSLEVASSEIASRATAGSNRLAKITATEAKQMMVGSVPARHRERLLSTLQYTTREYRFGNGGEEVETSRVRTVIGRLFKLEDVERAIEEYVSAGL